MPSKQRMSRRPHTSWTISAPIPRWPCPQQTHAMATHFNSDECATPFDHKVSMATSGLSRRLKLYASRKHLLKFTQPLPFLHNVFLFQCADNALSPLHFWSSLVVSSYHRLQRFPCIFDLPSIQESNFMRNGQTTLLFRWPDKGLHLIIWAGLTVRLISFIYIYVFFCWIQTLFSSERRM